MDYDACYQQPIKPTVNITATQGWRLTRGIIDSSNRDSLYDETPVTPGVEYEFKFPIMPVDYTIPAGHRVGVVLMANYNALQRNGTTGTTITLNAKASSRSRCRSSAGTTASSPRARWRPTLWRRSSPPPPANIDMTIADPTGAVVTFPLPAATDNEDPSPDVVCDHASGLEVPGRLDARHLHGDRRLAATPPGRRSPCSCAVRSRSAAPCPRRCR